LLEVLSLSRCEAACCRSKTGLYPGKVFLQAPLACLGLGPLAAGQLMGTVGPPAHPGSGAAEVIRHGVLLLVGVPRRILTPIDPTRIGCSRFATPAEFNIEGEGWQSSCQASHVGLGAPMAARLRYKSRVRAGAAVGAGQAVGASSWRRGERSGASGSSPTPTRSGHLRGLPCV